MPDLPRPAAAAAHPDAVLRVDADLRPAAAAAGRSGADHGGRGARSRGASQQIRKQYRLDQPIPVQYLYWVKGVLYGQPGRIDAAQEPVARLVLQKLPVTLQLASMALLIAIAIGIPAGIVSAVKKDTAWDYGANLFALWGLSTPNFWLGILMIFLFSVHLGWLPASGYVRLGRGLAGKPRHHHHAGLRARQRACRRADAPYPQRHAAGDEHATMSAPRAPRACSSAGWCSSTRCATP